MWMPFTNARPLPIFVMWLACCRIESVAWFGVAGTLELPESTQTGVRLVGQSRASRLLLRLHARQRPAEHVSRGTAWYHGPPEQALRVDSSSCNCDRVCDRHW